MDGLPALNRPITLIADSGDEFSSRVEDVGPDWLTVARPLEVPVDSRFLTDARFLTTWRADNGIHVLPCRLATARREGRIRLWDVDVVGEGWREQRRAFVRSPVPGTVAIRWPGVDGTECETTGPLEDLSEAALKFECRDGSVSVPDLPGRVVEVSMLTRGQQFHVTGEIVRVAPAPVRGRSLEVAPWHVVARFVDAGKVADDLRRIVFREQLRIRNGR